MTPKATMAASTPTTPSSSATAASARSVWPAGRYRVAPRPSPVPDHAPLASDTDFIRRVYLDLTARIPTPEEVRNDWPPHALLVVCSDGIETRWRPELLAPPQAEIEVETGLDGFNRVVELEGAAVITDNLSSHHSLATRAWLAGHPRLSVGRTQPFAVSNTPAGLPLPAQQRAFVFVNVAATHPPTRMYLRGAAGERGADHGGDALLRVCPPGP